VVQPLVIVKMRLRRWGKQAIRIAYNTHLHTYIVRQKESIEKVILHKNRQNKKEIKKTNLYRRKHQDHRQEIDRLLLF